MEQNDPETCQVKFVGVQRDALIKSRRNFTAWNQMNAECSDRRQQRANCREADKSFRNWHSGSRPLPAVTW